MATSSLMAKTYTVNKPGDDAEVMQLLELLAPIFHFSPERAPKFRDAIGDENYRVVRCGDELAGGLGLVHMGQYFGGRSVSMAGVVAVGIAVHYRAKGAASALMGAMLREMHREKRCAISTLYPATVPVYRKAGYEQAGGRYFIELPTASIDVRDHELSVRPIGQSDHAVVKDVYSAFAQQYNGLLDRGAYIWNRVRSPRGETAHGYLVHDEHEKVLGYLYYAVKEDGDREYLQLTDMAWLTASAARRLLTLLADHRSMEYQAVWHGGPRPDMFMALREQVQTIRLKEQWMLRLVDVPRALMERGYAPCVDCEVHLEVRDELIEANNGKFVLRVKDGSAQVQPGGRGAVQLHVRGLAALYAGHRTVGELMIAQLGQADARNAAMADAVFAGPESWMGDMF